VGFLMVQHAVIPTRVLPAPHGNTMIPDLARLMTKERDARAKVSASLGAKRMSHGELGYPLPNILLRLFS
jgi:hypothetical protein